MAVTVLFIGAVANAATVLSNLGTVVVEHTLPDPTDLWVTQANLPRVNGFELKPEGACLDEICIPIRQNEDSDIFITRQDTGWVNVLELARRIQQPVVSDHATQTFSLGEIPVQRQNFVRDGLAPDFELTDFRGETHQLSDFKGKKIMLLTWASW
ncbi:MAG: redoxin domain-containing protein [Pseudomonadales bacterium]|nr:redoxin domain-containing protein [Pseudomonadales bacterium]